MSLSAVPAAFDDICLAIRSLTILYQGSRPKEVGLPEPTSGKGAQRHMPENRIRSANPCCGRRECEGNSSPRQRCVRSEEETSGCGGVSVAPTSALLCWERTPHLRATFSHRLQPVVSDALHVPVGAGFSRASRLKGFIHAATCFSRHLPSGRLAYEQRGVAGKRGQR